MRHRHASSLPPRHDGFGPSFHARLPFRAMVVDLLRRRKRKDPDRGGVPVEPNRPNTLSGGAAVALEFEGE